MMIAVKLIVTLLKLLTCDDYWWLVYMCVMRMLI